MRHECSAGILLFHQQRPQAARDYLLLDYGSHWDFAKGHLQPGETPRITALRELLEETGIAAPRFLAGFEETIRYSYRKAGVPIEKCVVFFLAESPTRSVVLSHEHHAFCWLPYEEARERVTYQTARDLLARAHAFAADVAR
jgi:8-oxo-dGTP pyrophosphatase MutT (NUDIX family)